jgi:hypothetical protein
MNRLLDITFLLQQRTYQIDSWTSLSSIAKQRKYRSTPGRLFLSVSARKKDNQGWKHGGDGWWKLMDGHSDTA